MSSKKGKILIVDDNAGIRQALKILLPVHFAEVETLPSPVTLVSTLERFRPDQPGVGVEERVSGRASGGAGRVRARVRRG